MTTKHEDDSTRVAPTATASTDRLTADGESAAVTAAERTEDVHTGDDERMDLLINIRSALEQLREGEDPIDIDDVLDDCAALDALLVKTIQAETPSAGQRSDSTVKAVDSELVYVVQQGEGLRGVHESRALAEAEIADLCAEHQDLRRWDFIVHVCRIRRGEQVK